jgi:hypothetical protein
MSKRQNIDFASLDLEAGFNLRDSRGGVAGISEKVLTGGLDAAAKTGSRVRLLRLEPGVQTPSAHAHDYWEEIYILEGSMWVGDGDGGERRVVAPAFASREPSFMHGPVRTDETCTMIEFSWYPEPE